ncbi:hypothetical protein TH8_14830 [Thalassospira profundimaris]|nr:hypothetical protein TH8_14830 [Thalassospira profundimaris]
MAGIKISELTISDVIDHLRNGRWQVPKFQREFVWDTSAVAGLASSIIDAYPIGMATLWQQSHKDPLDLERLSIVDYDANDRRQYIRYFGEETGDPNLQAVLDGRQRCTAIAMAFAGFSPAYGGNKYCGRYFLNASQADPLERVVFIKRTDLERRGLMTSSACIGVGLFPLSSDDPTDKIMKQWYSYAQEIKNPKNYEGGVLPEETELQRRNEIVQAAFDGITSTKLAVCTVPETYDLGKICEIFETLNLTGMKVSTVDLINAWLYRETQEAPEGALQLREWIRDLGDMKGAIGWAVPEKRPELIAQMVTAAFVAMSDSEDKPKPRRISGSKVVTRITSVKSPDLLATPPDHWRAIVSKKEEFASYIGDFQKCVAGGTFPYDKSPYPISAAIYVGLRWHKDVDPVRETDAWELEDLDPLYKAFFWRNALSTRYDQGFLTTLGRDIGYLKSLLARRSKFSNQNDWLSFCDERMSNDTDMPNDVPSYDRLVEILTNDKPSGAMSAALQLPMLARTKEDIFGRTVSFDADRKPEMHHIFPRKWCSLNANDELIELLDSTRSSKNWVGSISNLMPIPREVNNKWKDSSPGEFFAENGITYEGAKGYFDAVFIDECCFDILNGQSNLVGEFWLKRASLISEYLIKQSLLQ